MSRLLFFVFITVLLCVVRGRSCLCLGLFVFLCVYVCSPFSFCSSLSCLNVFFGVVVSSLNLLLPWFALYVFCVFLFGVLFCSGVFICLSRLFLVGFCLLTFVSSSFRVVSFAIVSVPKTRVDPYMLSRLVGARPVWHSYRTDPAQSGGIGLGSTTYLG